MRKLGVLLFGSIVTLSSGWALAADPIKIGALLTYSGVYSSIGDDITSGLELALAEAGNAVADRPLVVIRADTEVKPNVALAKAKELVGSDKVDFLVGPVSSAESVALRDFVAQSRIPMLAPNALAQELIGERCTPYIVSLGYSQSQLTRPIAEWMARNGIRTVFGLAPDYVGPRDLIGNFTKWFTKAGGKVVGTEFTPFGSTTDFGPYLAKIKEAKPDALYVFYGGREAIAFVKQASDFRLQESMKLTGAGATVSPLILGAEGDAAIGFIGGFTYAPSIDTPENRAFTTSYSEKYHRPVSEFSVQGYNTGRFIVEALRATGGKTDDSVALTKAVRAVHIAGPSGPLSIDPVSDNVVQNLYVYQVVKAGAVVQFKILDIAESVKDESSGCVLNY